MFKYGVCGNGGPDDIYSINVFCIFVENRSHPKLGAVRQFCVVITSCICWGIRASLTFKNLASYIYIGRAYFCPPDVEFYIFFSTNISTEYFKHAAHSPFFSSKCRLFHNATFFGSCIIHILHTGCAKI